MHSLYSLGYIFVYFSNNVVFKLILNPRQRLIQHITETTDLSLETVYLLFYISYKLDFKLVH